MSEPRVFKCKVFEGTYSGVVIVYVNTELIEMYGNEAIESAAWQVWQRQTGGSIGMAYTSVKILEEVE